MVKLLENLEKYLLYLLLFLVPLAVVGIFANPFETPKVMTLTVGVILLLLIVSAKSLIKGTAQISVSNFDLPIILLAAIYLVSGLTQTPNKMEAFLVP